MPLYTVHVRTRTFRFAMLTIGLTLIGIVSLASQAIPTLAASRMSQVDPTGAGPNMNTPRNWHLAVSLPDGRAVVFGGRTTGFNPTNTAEVWSPESNAFSSLTMQYTHDLGTVARLKDGRFLLAGGMSMSLGVGFTESAEIYDPDGNSFSKTGNMARPRSAAGAATLTDGRVLIVGAWWNENFAQYGEVYDPSLGTFKATGALGTGRAHPLVLPTDDGGAVVIGLSDTFAGGNITAVERYNPATNQFSVVSTELFAGESGWHLAENPFGRVAESFRAGDGRDYFLVSKDSQIGLAVFDPASGALSRWSGAGAANLPAYATSTLADPALARLYVLEYQCPNSQFPCRLQVYEVDLASGTVSKAGESVTLNHALSGNGQQLLANGQLFFTGGSQYVNGDNFSPTAATVLVVPAGAQPFVETVLEPALTRTLDYIDLDGTTTRVLVRAHTVTETTTLRYTPLESVPPGISEDFDVKPPFSLNAYRQNKPLPSFSFEQPVTVTMGYTDDDVKGRVESSLVLRYLNEGIWQDAACGAYERAPDANTLSVPVCHLSTFALFGKPANTTYLPFIRGKPNVR